MTKRERAIRAMADKLDLRDATFGLGAALDAAMAIMAEPDQPPEGKLRVRVCVGQDEYGNWVATGAKGLPDDIAKSEVTDRVLTDYWRPQFHWIEADIPKWQPPAEETVQGREVGE